MIIFNDISRKTPMPVDYSLYKYPEYAKLTFKGVLNDVDESNKLLHWAVDSLLLAGSRRLLIDNTALIINMETVDVQKSIDSAFRIRIQYEKIAFLDADDSPLKKLFIYSFALIQGFRAKRFTEESEAIEWLSAD